MAINRESGKRHQESPNEKLMRKFRENPLVPIGALLTTGFLVNGLFKFGRRDSAASQKMMRGRIAAQVSLWSSNLSLKYFYLQGFTILALMGGVGLQIKQKTWVKPSAPQDKASE